MAVSVFLEFPGVTREQYEQLAQDMALSGPPEGVLVHVCGPTSEGGGDSLTYGRHRRRSSALRMSCSSPARRHAGFPNRPSESFSNLSTF